ncbi:MAG: PAS domain S-box protein [Desulfobacteraceae bacterium]|nr:PAS domain S-box protein [Desulfobacteraceae bacterium]
METKPTYDDLEKRLSRLKETLAQRLLDREKLEENHRLYQAIFENNGVGILLRDLGTGQRATFNKKALEDLGYTDDEYQHLESHENIAQEDRDHLKILLEKGSHTSRSKIIIKDGTPAEILRSDVLETIGEKKYAHNIRMDLSAYLQILEKLRESEERYRNILESMEEGYYETDLAGNLTFFSPAFVRIYGRPAEEMLGMNNREFMTQETAKRVHSFFNELYRTGKTPFRNLEFDVIKKDGSIAFAEISVSLIKNPQGEIAGFRGIVRDTTEKKKMEEELQDRETMYRTIFDHAGFAITLIDPGTGDRVAYNKNTYEALGYTEKEYKKITPKDFSVTSEEEFSAHFITTMEKGSHAYPVQLRKKDGEIRDFFQSSVQVKTGGKNYIHSISVDVTEQKKAERALQESETRFRNIFEAAADAIFIIDLYQGRILDANQTATTYLGYDREKLLDVPYEELVDDPGERTKIFKDLIKTGVSFHGGIHRKKDGTPVHVEISSCVMDYQGEKAALSIVRNITERKQMEEKLDRYRENLEEMVTQRTLELEATREALIQKEKMAILGQLTATVSHELRNPLGVIQSSNYYLQKRLEDRDETTDKHFKRIDEQVVVCDAIVGDLLEYTRGTHAELIKDNIPDWLNPLLDRVFEYEGILVNREISKDLPMIFHDRLKMQRVVINILNNATQAMEEKAAISRKNKSSYEPAIHLMAKEQEEGIVIQITDNGIGMAKNILDQAFTPLFTTRARGTGLGLANVLKIMEEHGGKIHITSIEGEGTTATVFLPFKPLTAL